MNPKESAPTRFELPIISPKTSNGQLQEFVRRHWPSDDRKRVALDIVRNGKELLAGHNTNWDLVLSNIRVVQVNTPKVGEAAIAVNEARFIGGLAARAGWSMHDPGSVYLSGIYLAHIADSKLEEFKTTMTKAAVCYAENTFPEDELLMKTLDLLLGHRDRRNHSNLVTRIASLLGGGNVQDAYTMVSSRGDRVRSRA